MRRKAVRVDDFAINARVRQTLARRWIQHQSLEVGTTDGVVLVKGRLVMEPGGLEDPQEGFPRERFVRRLKTELAAIPGVVDVVVEFHRSDGSR
jgi:hypothetical protein